MKKKIKLIDADLHVDNRGELIFCNNFDMSKIKRFYNITNFSNPFIRAWHGHKYEDKYIMVTKGSTFVLSDKKPKLLYIPRGHAHGYKTLLPDTRLTIFSTSTLKESIKDDFRYEAYYWNPWTIKERQSKIK